MPEPVALTLILMTSLLVKHAIADYALQTAFMFKNKGRYGHPGGLLHALLHLALTAPVLLLLTSLSPMHIALILGAEFIIHYHIDWSKEQICAHRTLDPECRMFWVLHGLDQLLHGLTYIGIVAIVFILQGA